MTPTQKLQLEQSKNRSEIAAILNTDADKRADSWQTDLEGLTKRAQSLELELRAAIVAGDEESTEETTEETTEEDTAALELRQLEDSISFAPYLRAALAGRGLASGPESEYNAETGLSEEQFPLSLLTRDDDVSDLETRAAVDGEAATKQGSWIDRLFSDTAARRLGVTFPSVAPGMSAYPVTTAGGDPKQRGRTEAAAENTYSVAVTELKPTRNSVHGVYSIEDNARLPGLADAILRDMRAAMVEKIDRTVFVGDSGANENTADITGLTTAGIAEITLTQTNKVMGLEWLKLLAALMDGKHAASMADINLVLSVGANQLLMGTKEADTISNETVAAFLRANGVSWSTRGDIEVDTDNNDFGAFVGLKRGQAGTAVAPVWSGATLVRDPYSGAKSGEVQLTLSYLWAFGIPRTDNYRRLKFVT